MHDTEFRLLNDFQRGFPLTPRPYADIAGQLGVTEADVIAALRQLHKTGRVGRVGATVIPGRLGAATLAAMAVPEARIDEVAAFINDYREVNHNYEREHRYNLWFVVTAPGQDRVDTVVRDVERRARCGRVLSLPMVEPYYVDVGFDLHVGKGDTPRRARADPALPAYPVPYMPHAREAALLAALQSGLPLAERPYAELGSRTGMREEAVIETLQRLLRERVISRLGVIVRHRELGYDANAMAVWDVPNTEVRAAGRRLARHDFVTLCYRRLRHLPDWRYNLYGVIHGTSRGTVAAQIGELNIQCGLAGYASEVLFTRRRFKQCAARYVEEVERGRYRPHGRESAAGRVSRL